MVKDVIKSSLLVARSLWCWCYPVLFFIQIWFCMFVISVFSLSDNFIVSVLPVIKENMCVDRKGRCRKGN